MKTVPEIRQDFIDFFRNNGHKFLPPSKIFSEADKTTFFTIAGMCQLKDYFLGLKTPEPGFNQLVNSQICLRAGGHKCDIEEVGDKTHNTLFEMLGQWSIASYGKETAIDLAYKYMTERCKLNPEQMYITYFEGNSDVGPDNETKELWKKYLPEERIFPGSFKDNFWSMHNDTGPCGACTEIHYDLTGNRFVPELVNVDGSGVVEIWNNVFMEYNRTKEGYQKLKALSVDTGLGLERLAMVIQGKQTIYQTDAFRYLLGYCQALTNAEFYKDTYDGNMADKSYRIFADHIRAVIIALFDGVEFGSYEREFVLRKIFRRLLTHLYLYLNNGLIEQVFTKPIVKAMISDVLCYFGKKKHNADEIWTKLINEEKLFIGKLVHMELFVKYALKKNNNKEEVFKDLHDSKGLPMELLQNIDKVRFL